MTFRILLRRFARRMYLHASARSTNRATPPIAAPTMIPLEIPAGLVGLVEIADGCNEGDGFEGTTDVRVDVVAVC